jgi:NAD(P)-dependent dehydrogenase (short-subunit alcohol dehydrogenase family)
MSDSSNAAASWQQATSLVGKSVVVTGGASGIGRATALQFASAGAKVLIGDVNVEQAAATAKQIRAAGGEAESLPLDLTDGASIDAFVDQVMTRLGGAPDILASACELAVLVFFSTSC